MSIGKDYCPLRVHKADAGSWLGTDNLQFLLDGEMIALLGRTDHLPVLKRELHVDANGTSITEFRPLQGDALKHDGKRECHPEF